jgi:hypothetical protein
MTFRRRVTTILLFLVLSATVLGALFIVAARYGQRWLVAELITLKVEFAIPGISKAYEAKVVNRGLLPARVDRCDFVDDALSKGRMVAFAVQRWDEKAQAWKSVVQLDGTNFCKPYPLGIMQAKVAHGWLWPGQAISTGQEATAARGAFHRGDRARFVVFLKQPGDYSSSLATESFVIDEEITGPDVGYRVRH